MNWQNSFTVDYKTETYLNGPVQDTAGSALQPDWKSNATFGYRFENHFFAWNINYTASTSENEEPVFSNETPTGELSYTGHLPSWTIHNVSYTYDAGKLGVVSLGVNNLFNRDPVLNSFGQYQSGYEDLYNNFGREYTANYTISF